MSSFFAFLWKCNKLNDKTQQNKTRTEQCFLNILYTNINCSYFCLLTKCIRRSIRDLQTSYVYGLDAAMLEMLDLSREDQNGTASKYIAAEGESEHFEE